jgi:hypothetical protein
VFHDLEDSLSVYGKRVKVIPGLGKFSHAYLNLRRSGAFFLWLLAEYNLNNRKATIPVDEETLLGPDLQNLTSFNWSLFQHHSLSRRVPKKSVKCKYCPRKVIDDYFPNKSSV